MAHNQWESGSSEAERGAEAEKQYDYYEPNGNEPQRDLEGRLFTEDIREFPLDAAEITRAGAINEGPHYFFEQRDGKLIQWKVTGRDSARLFAGGKVDPSTYIGLVSGNFSREIVRTPGGGFTDRNGNPLDSNWTAGLAERRYMKDDSK